MPVPLIQQLRVGGYIVKQKLLRRKRYPLVLMLEPLFRCNLACAGCGKIDYPPSILNKRLSAEESIGAAEECGAPIVSIAGGEPLLHKEIVPIVNGLIARKKFVYLCTNALLLDKRMDDFTPTPYLTFSIHLDGPQEHHDKAVCQDGVFEKATAAIKKAVGRGFRVTINCTVYANADIEHMATFFDYVCNDLGVEGITVAPGFSYERAPNQETFLHRGQSKQTFRDLLKKGVERKAAGREWRFNQSSLYMDFLAGNQTYRCTPWGNPTRNVFGWQRPCYLLSEGIADSFSQLMDETDWDAYGTGNYEKCADCMMHCGYEPTAVEDTVAHPLKALQVALKGPRTDGPMAPDLPLDNQRPAEYRFEELRESLIAEAEAEAGADKANNAA